MPDKDTILTEQNRTEQNRTEQNRTEQNRTEQNRTEQNRTAWANCALFASCDSETFQTAYYIRDG